jgi:hypothetical protein
MTQPTDLPSPWYVENRMRAFLLLILALFVMGATVFGTVVYFTVTQLKQTAPYRLAVEQASKSQAVQQQLGRPLEPAWLALGQIDEERGYGELTLRLKGPRGKGTVRAIAETADGGDWRLVFLDVACYGDFGVDVVQLIADKPPTGPDLPEPTDAAKEEYGVSE